MNRKFYLKQLGETKVPAVPYGRRRFLAGMVVLMFCLSLFSSDARALLDIVETGTSDVYGLYDIDDISLAGSEFGWVIAIASDNDAYSLFSDGNDIIISGEFGSSGTIEALAGAEHAYGLYSPNGSITTDALNGIINAVAGGYRAVGLFTEDANITTGDIGGSINAVAGGSSAFGLRSDYDLGLITTGAISGTINVVAGGNRAYGFRSYGSIDIGDINGTIIATAAQSRAYGLSGEDSITTGDINGTITAIVSQDYAYGLYSSDGTITTGAINGTIIADANNGSDAYGLYAYGDIIVDGNIGSTANISATAEDGVAGLYSSNGSINIGDIDGTISATATGGLADTVYGLYADVNLTTGAINGTITAEEIYGSGAYALYAGSDLTVDGNIGSSAVISATAGQDWAVGLYSENGSINVNGVIDGNITATAGQDLAAGLYSSGGDSIYTGAINGTITADANGSDAYGLYAYGDITVDGDIGSNALISATAGTDNAYGMYSDEGGSIYIGDINGTITATATTGSYAAGLYCEDSSIYTDAINGTITAIAQGERVYGLNAGDSIYITGDVNGTISATATTGSYAYGLYSTYDTVIDGDIGSNALISATATNGSYAYGLYSYNGSITTDAINGTIIADANGYNAYALYAYEHLDVDGIGDDALITATAGDSNAYGLYSANGDSSIHIDGDMNGTISAFAETDNAAGLYSNSGSIYTGAINGIITADANTGSNAYGLYSYGHLDVDGIGDDALISATAGDSNAYGLYSANGDSSIHIDGDMNGTISAFAETDNAAGLYSENGSIYTGAINGIITADANTGSNAYGLYSYGHLDVDGIGDDALITATAGDSNAYGLYSANGDSSIDIDGDIDGTINATAGDSNAAGLYSANGSIYIDDIDGAISATATAGSNAYGLYSGNGSIYTDYMDGTITATAGQDNAAGLYSANGSIDVYYIDGAISATATAGSNAYGLYSGNGSIDTGDIDGTISADANGSNAYALYAYDDIDIDGDIGSTALITAEASDSNAYALYSDGNIYIDDDIGSGALISATAGQDNAAGLYSGGSIYTGAINGTITADANNYAYGLNSYGHLDVDGIGGDANIIATAGTDWAAGLYSSNDSIDVDGDMDGKITATATTGSDAYGLFSGNGSINIDGDMNGTIIATAGTNNAYGLYSVGGSITTGDIDGTITATAGQDEAYALYSLNSLLITGAINGTISADANHSYAYALYSLSDLTIDGDIGSKAQITATAGGNRATGLYADNGSININGDIDGTIISEAGGDNAYGLYSRISSITTGAINGTITADANGSNAYGLYANGDITVDGDIGSSAYISATADGDDAAGLYSANSSITTGAINGTITATAAGAGNDSAYGLYSGDSLTTGAINGTISAEMTNGSGAYALYAGSDMYITGDIGSDANITATARDWTAVGLYTANGSITTGDVGGTITAMAGNQAYGLRSNNGDINTDDIGSTAVITAMSQGNRAYGLLSTNGSITTDAINGTINATAGGDRAYGLYSTNGGSINTGNIDGDVNATADYMAYGLFSEGSLTTDDIGGTITATVAHETAYGLRSWGDITTGDIDGEITATAGVRKAAALFSEGSLTTGAISGIIDANCDGDYAYAILSYGPMDVTIDGGEVNAVAHGGTHAAAIQSGRIGAAAIGLQTQNADDTVEIVAGSAIVGDINLARTTDDDLLILSGVNTNSTTFDDDIMNIETINIIGGHWYINGTVSDSANGITMDGGILSGTGTLSSLIINSGTLAPGSSIGTTTFDGDLTLGPAAVYEVDVNNSDQADLVVVTGTANLDGTIRGNALEDIDHSFSAIVLDANTGLNGGFATVAGSTAFLIYSVDYNTTDYDVLLNVDPITDFAYYSLTGNQGAIGNLLNELEGTGGDMDDVIDVIRDLPDGDAVNDAYNQMMPQDMLGLPEIIRRTMNQFNDNIMDRMDGIRKGRLYSMLGSNSRYLLASADNSTALPPKIDKWTPFVKGFGIWGDRDTEADITGYRYSVYGTVVGLDNLISENMLFGFGVGILKANVDYSQYGAEADIDSVLCSLYGSYFQDDWHIDWTAAYGHSWYDLQRGIHFGSINRQAKSDHQGNVYSAAIEFGKNFGDDSMIFEPIAGLGYTLVQERGYKEKGADALNLKVDADTTDGFYSKLGIRAAKEFRTKNNPDMVIVPQASVFWIHDFAERVELSSSFVGGGSFKTDGQDPIRDMFNIGTALNVYFSNSLRLFVDYSWQSSGDFNSNMAQVGVRWAF